eukprot:COSAG02_NODE_27150_length_616_cov_0.729207_2_plen_56_part_01
MPQVAHVLQQPVAAGAIQATDRTVEDRPRGELVLWLKGAGLACGRLHERGRLGLVL